MEHPAAKATDMNPKSSFFKDLQAEAPNGVAYKNLTLKKKLLNHLASTGDATITDLSKALRTSTPKVNTLVSELIEAGLVKDFGKVESTVGRRPSLYGLRPDSCYFLGVEVTHNRINIGLINFQKELIKTSRDIPYRLDNTPESLDALCNVINDFVGHLTVNKSKIVGVGVNLTGRVNYRTGHSFSYFHFNELPLTKTIRQKTGIPTFLENDSRAMAYGEFTCGIVKGEKNVLFINIDHGIGLGMLVDGQLYYGKSGFSGEFGHIPVFDNEIICQCGKKGCLETEASGKALVQAFRQKIEEGATSIATRNGKAISEIELEDIIAAAKNDDVLAIELIGEAGEKLGKGVALLINLFNPEMVILGGKLSSTGDVILLPVKSAIQKYSIQKISSETAVNLSQLGDTAGILGACLLVRNRLFS